MSDDVSRRAFLAAGGLMLAGAALAKANAPVPGENLKDLPEPINIPPAPDKKIGFAIVGLGRLSLNQILPAFANTEHCRVTALVTGHPDEKGKPLARRFGVPEKNIYTYDNYDSIKDNPDIDAVYIVLPNAQHAEYTIRAAKAGKHVLCEKPMGNTAKECQAMVDACKAAGKKLMVAYRLQYEPLTLQVQQMVKDKTLGKIKVVTATNCQNEHPGTWRTDKALSGFGALADIGIYCLNTTRFILQEEPVELQAYGYSTPNDPRWGPSMFETVTWTMRFPSGAVLNATCSYGANLKYYGLAGEDSQALVTRAYGYHGQRLEYQLRPKAGEKGPAGWLEANAPDSDQFAKEMDELALAIMNNTPVRASGEEGVRDMGYIEAIQKSADAGGQLIKLA